MSVLQEVDAGRPLNEISRRHGISAGAYYKRKAKFGGLDASDMKWRPRTTSAADVCRPDLGERNAQ